MKYTIKNLAIVEAKYNRQYKTGVWEEGEKEKCKNEVI